MSATQGWKYIGIRVRVREDADPNGWTGTMALVRGPFAVHRTLGHGRSWTLSVVANGYAIATHLRTRQAAQRLAAEIEPLTDWAATGPGACPLEIKPTVRAALARARGRVAVTEAAS
jgi:hypothetical protein